MVLSQLAASPGPGVARLIFRAHPPPSCGANGETGARPALPSSVPAEVAAPSKRGPSAFILPLPSSIELSLPSAHVLGGGVYLASSG